MKFSRDVMRIDAASTAVRIQRTIQEQVLGTLHRRGAVVGISGGVNSAVVAALCVRALGKERVLGLLMPERDTSGDATRLGRALAGKLGIEVAQENLGPVLDAFGCYRLQAEAIRTVFPQYGEGWRCKVTLPSILEGDRLNIFQLTVESPTGQRFRSRMPPSAFLLLVAATNFKQRSRTTLEYFHADRLCYAVAGTPNRLEYDQGFFVKQGDGAADIKPIAHLYKTQVYALAEHLEVPAAIRERPPTTDTYSLDQTQEEFYFAVPFDRMDLCLWARDHDVPFEEAAPVVDLSPEQVERVYRDIDGKRRTTRYLHLQPLLVEDVERG